MGVHLERGLAPLLVWSVDPGEYFILDFVTLWLTQGCALGPLEVSALAGKMSSLEGKEGGGNLKLNGLS